MKRIFKTADGLVVVDLVRCGIDHLSAAKLLFDSVGVGAVQEALSGMAYYKLSGCLGNYHRHIHHQRAGIGVKIRRENDRPQRNRQPHGATRNESQ